MSRVLMKLAAFTAGFSPTLALAQVQPEVGIGLPRDVSLEGHRIDWLIQITGVFVAILFVIMCIWMVIAMVRHNQKTNEIAEYDHGSTRHHVITACVISALIFLVVDGNLFYHSIVDLDEAFWNWDRTKTEDTVRVQVNARQWAWDFRYPGPDGKFATEDDITTLNEFRVPVDRPISVQMSSIDVIHSFYLPNLRVKTDAVPGTVTRFWFQAKETGEFDVACAQHCGTHHYKMKGKITILENDDYERWLEEAAINSKLDYEPVIEDRDPRYSSAHWGWNWDEQEI